MSKSGSSGRRPLSLALGLVASAGLAMVVPTVSVAHPALQQPQNTAPGQAARPAAATLPITPVRTRIGTASNSQPIEVITLGAAGPDAHGRSADQRPAVLVVAGLQGHHTIGVRTAQAIVDRLITAHADLLQDRTVYIIPNAAPGADAWVNGRGGLRVESGRIPVSGDVDRDGRANEDPPEDLNGDGMVTQMRVRNPDARWGLGANLIPNPDEPRLMRAAKTTEGEVGQWAVLTEGIDNDGDGRFNEDGGGALTGGTDLSMNFPTHWPEHEDGAGAYALSSPEALAIVKWVQAHDNILAVVVYDPHDTIVNIPATGQYGPEGSVPRGIEEGDKAYHQRIADAFKEVTRMTGAGASPGAGRTAGSFASWAYGDFGVLTFSTPVWVRPDQIKQESSDNQDGAGDAEGGGGAEPPDPAAQAAAAKARFIAEGYPDRMAEFLAASPDQRRAIIQQAATMTEAEQAAMMAEMMSLSPAQQQRLMEAAREAGMNMGPRGGAPPAGAPGGPPGHDHDHEEESPTRRLSLVDIPFIGSPMFGVGAQPAGAPGGRRFGGGAPGGGGAPSGGRGAPGGGESSGEDGKWLTYSDEQRDGAGFVAWTPFDHPQLGPVEIGGFVPGFRVNPPESEFNRLADEQAAFLAKLLPMLPDVVLGPIGHERVGPGMWRVRAGVSNPGFLPTISAIGLKARRVTPIVVQISTDPRQVLTGQRVRRFDSIDGSGGSREAEWLILGQAGEQVTIEVRSSVFGTRTATITLGQAPGGNQAPGQGGGR